MILRLTIFLFSVISSCVLAFPEKKFAIIVTSYNNRDWYQKNLESIFCQKYTNWRLIYIDDCSSDGTAELVDAYIQQQGFQDKVLLIKNKMRMRALANLYNAVHSCADDEIVFNIDGDDWLAHEKVFAFINQLYQNEALWITYGQFQNWPTGELGYCKAVPEDWIEKKSYRKRWWKPGQLRTFYAWLFKQVQFKDLLFEGPLYHGLFFPANADLAVYYAMMEMAGHHFKFISDIIYIRNVKTPLNDFKANKDIQMMGSKLIREKPVYPTLTDPAISPATAHQNATADIIIMSKNAGTASRLIESSRQFLIHTANIYLLHDGLSDDSAYQELATKQNVFSISISVEYTVMQALNDIAKNGATQHVLLLHDRVVFNKAINISQCIALLEQTFAYGFYFDLHPHAQYQMHNGSFQEVPPLNEIGNDFRAWAFDTGQNGQWKYPRSSIATLYRMKDLIGNAVGITGTSIQEWLHECAEVEVPGAIGVCCHHPCLTLPLE